MLQLRNRTALAAHMSVFPDADGIDTLIVTVKGTFTFAGILSDVQDEILLEDRYVGEPGESSLACGGDISLPKNNTDVVLVGHTHAPGGVPAQEVLSALTVGSVHHQVRIHGERVWKKSLFRVRPSEAEPFATMPLTWERAFGGSLTLRDSSVAAHSHNPVGKGWWKKNATTPLIGGALPNLEDPTFRIISPNDESVPSCFAAVCPHWLPRRTFAGTYDQAWQRKRAPYLPADFDARFLQIAAEGLIAKGHLLGNEMVELKNLTASGHEQFDLPGLALAIDCQLRGQNHAMPAHLDTVFINADTGTCALTWHAAYRCDKDLLAINSVTIALRDGDMVKASAA